MCTFLLRISHNAEPTAEVDEIKADPLEAPATVKECKEDAHTPKLDDKDPSNEKQEAMLLTTSNLSKFNQQQAKEALQRRLRGDYKVVKRLQVVSSNPVVGEPVAPGNLPEEGSAEQRDTQYNAASEGVSTEELNKPNLEDVKTAMEKIDDGVEDVSLSKVKSSGSTQVQNPQNASIDAVEAVCKVNQTVETHLPEALPQKETGSDQNDSSKTAILTESEKLKMLLSRQSNIRQQPSAKRIFVPDVRPAHAQRLRDTTFLNLNKGMLNDISEDGTTQPKNLQFKQDKLKVIPPIRAARAAEERPSKFNIDVQPSPHGYTQRRVTKENEIREQTKVDETPLEFVYHADTDSHIVKPAAKKSKRRRSKRGRSDQLDDSKIIKVLFLLSARELFYFDYLVKWD